MITDEDMATAKMRFPYNTPGTKEGRRPTHSALYYIPTPCTFRRCAGLLTLCAVRRSQEGCYFRTIFHSHFPNNNYGNGIERTVPGGPSVACSTAKAIEWDAAWSDPTRQDQSGRFVDTHDAKV